MKLGQEMYACRECRIFDPMTYVGEEVQYWILENGMTMTFPSRQVIHLCSDFIPCDKHLKELQ